MRPMSLIPDWIKPGIRVMWRYRTQRPKEHPIPVPAIVRKVTKVHVTIEFASGGERVLRAVLPGQLSPRTMPAAELGE